MIILIFFMNANIIKTQIFIKLKFDLKAHLRSHEVTFISKISLFLDVFFYLKSVLIVICIHENNIRAQFFYNMKCLTLNKRLHKVTFPWIFCYCLKSVLFKTFSQWEHFKILTNLLIITFVLVLCKLLFNVAWNILKQTIHNDVNDYFVY